MTALETIEIFLQIYVKRLCRNPIVFCIEVGHVSLVVGRVFFVFLTVLIGPNCEKNARLMDFLCPRPETSAIGIS